MNKVEVKVFNKGYQTLPQYESLNSAGFDFKADFSTKNFDSDFLGNKKFLFNNDTKELRLLANGGRVLIPTGLHIALPEGYELQVRPRSGLSLKHGISIVNSPGTIDQDFLGEIGVILINTDPEIDFIIKNGERIAQGVIKKCEQLEWNIVDTLDDLGDTVRGQGGFGHTGTK
jgi:dUTP pyrophosphatase